MSIVRDKQNKGASHDYRRLLVVLAMALAALFCFYNLGGRSISRADESLYARSVQEMLQNSSWIPTLHGSPFLHKPPLTQLLISLAVTLAGDATWVYRVPGAIAGFIYLLLVAVFSYRLFNSLLVSAASFVAILSCRMLFSSHLIREATPDGILVLFLLMGLMLGWELYRQLTLHRERSRRVLVFSGLFGLSVLLALLVKSVAGLLSLVVWWLWMLVCQRGALTPVRRMVLVCLLTTIIPVALFAVSYLALLNAVPGTFGAAVQYEVIEKLLGEGHHNTELPYYYFSQLFVQERAFPALVLVAALFLGVLKALRGDTRCAYLSMAIFVPLCGYSFLHSRLYWYVAPVFAPCAMLLGNLCASCVAVIRQSERRQLYRLGAALCGLVVATQLGRNIVQIASGQLFTKERTNLETKILETMAAKASNPNLRIVRLCIDPKDQYFKSLLLREWFYLDMLKPVSVSVCEVSEVQAELSALTAAVVVTAPHLERLLPQTIKVLERSTVRVDRWKGITKPDRVRELVFLLVG
jgi:4-amino-4-deoxy-L-arabinose transferase-like glycosyltransferase